MNLCFSGHILLAGLFLSVSALTPEECQPMVTPLSLADHSVIAGRYNTLAGYTDNEALNGILNVTDSSWMTFSASTVSPNEVLMFEINKMNGQCFESTVNMSIEGNIIRMSLTNWSSVFHMLPTCKGCVVISSNTTTNDLDQFLHMLEISSPVGQMEIHARAVYLMCREVTLKDSDLEHFKLQASCLGFSGEPNFHYDPKKGFCSEGEGKVLVF